VPAVHPGYDLPSYPAGGAVAVPHSAQNLAVGASVALQFAQCLDVGVPHSAQNFEPAGIWFWQLLHAIIAAAGTASCTGAGGGAAGADAGAGWGGG
jgi:hypothetical protein